MQSVSAPQHSNPCLTQYLIKQQLNPRTRSARHGSLSVPGLARAMGLCNGTMEVVSWDASALSKLNSWRLPKLIKIKSARSRLYRRRFLQVNTRWKALAEIYTMHSFAPLSNLKIFVKNRWIVCCFFPKFRKFAQRWPNFAEFSPNLTNFFRDFCKMQHFS